MSDKKVLRLTVITATPLIISEKRYHSNFTSALDYIPGSSVYGAVVGNVLMKKAYEENNTELRNIIGNSYRLANDNGARLYAALVKNNGLAISDFNPVGKADAIAANPPVMGLAKCRRNPKHLNETTLRMILKYIAYSDKNGGKKKFTVHAPPICRIDGCGSPLKKKPVYTYITEENGKRYKIVKITPRKTVKIGIGTGAVTLSVYSEKEKGMLYSAEMLEKGNMFAGTVVLDTESDFYGDFIEALSRMSIGAGKNRGYGIIVPTTGDSVSDRLNTENGNWKKELERKTEDYDRYIDRLVKKYEKYAGITSKLLECEDMIIPFYLYSHTPIGTFYKLHKIITEENTGAQPDEIEITLLEYKNITYKMRDMIRDKWTTVECYKRGSTGFIRIRNGSFNRKLARLLAQIQTEGIEYGEWAKRGLGRIEFYPDIFYIESQTE